MSWISGFKFWLTFHNCENVGWKSNEKNKADESIHERDKVIRKSPFHLIFRHFAKKVHFGVDEVGNGAHHVGEVGNTHRDKGETEQLALLGLRRDVAVAYSRSQRPREEKRVVVTQFFGSYKFKL